MSHDLSHAQAIGSTQCTPGSGTLGRSHIALSHVWLPDDVCGCGDDSVMVLYMGYRYET